MHKLSRTAGALVAVIALSVVATPAHASTSSAVAAAASVAKSDSVLSQVPVQAEMEARFKPWKCGEHKYLRNHKRECKRFFRSLRNHRGHDRDGNRHDRDGNRHDRDNGDHDGGRWDDNDRHGGQNDDSRTR